MECTPAVFIIHIFPVCYVLAFFCDERCCRVLELSCYLSCLNQECVGGYLRTKYCRISCHIFELVAGAEWLGLGEASVEAKHSPLILPVYSYLAARFAVPTRIDDQFSICCCLTFHLKPVGINFTSVIR